MQRPLLILQNPSITILNIVKLNLNWSNGNLASTNQGRVHCLASLLERCLKINRIDLPDNIKTCIIEHLQIVSAEFPSNFNDNTVHVLWYRDPFDTEIDHNAEEAEELEEFKVSNAMKLAFNVCCDINFAQSRRSRISKVSSGEFKNTLRTDYGNLK